MARLREHIEDWLQTQNPKTSIPNSKEGWRGRSNCDKNTAHGEIQHNKGHKKGHKPPQQGPGKKGPVVICQWHLFRCCLFLNDLLYS